MTNKQEDEFDSIVKRLESALEGKTGFLANGKLNELEPSSFIETIKNPHTAVVEFYTQHCPYCRQMNPILKDLAEFYEARVYFAKVDVGDKYEFREKFRIIGVPAIIAFKKGLEVARVEGLQKYGELDNWIDSIHQGLRPMGMESGSTTKAL